MGGISLCRSEDWQILRLPYHDQRIQSHCHLLWAGDRGQKDKGDAMGIHTIIAQGKFGVDGPMVLHHQRRGQLGDLNVARCPQGQNLPERGHQENFSS